MCSSAVAITALVRTYSMVTNTGKLDQNEVPIKLIRSNAD